MKIKALLVGVLAIGLVATPALAKKKPSRPAEPPCVKDKVLTALQMRMMQTELVVGALSCQMTPRYNDFVNAYKVDLMTAHHALLKFFGREAKMEDYKSKTANEVSQRSLANIGEFCSYTTALYDKLLGPVKPDLATFVATEPVAAHHGFDVCGAPSSLVTASAAGTPSVASGPIPMPRVKPDVEAAAVTTHSGRVKSHVKPVDASAGSVPTAEPTAPPATTP